jgi:hypothetical protein
MPMPKVNRVGHRSGKLLVLNNISPSKPGNRGGEWLCQCDCGNTKIVKGNDLRGATKSCGCLEVENLSRMTEGRRKYRETTINAQYCIYCQNNSRHKDFTPLDRKTWESLVFQPCAYCGGFDTRNNHRRQTRIYTTLSEVTPEQIARYDVRMNGIDRIDSSKTYDLDNCVPCCGMCNYLKQDYAQFDFLARVDKIHAYRNRDFCTGLDGDCI